MRREVSDFFDDYAAQYHAEDFGNEIYNELIARRIESGLDGTVLSIGGLWDQGSTEDKPYEVVLADLSREMLRAWTELGPRAVCCDALTPPFAAGSLDHVVMPLIVHHIAGDNGVQARRLAREVLRRTLDVVRPGGQLWISDFLVARVVYAVELALGPLTRAALSLVGQPLVVMHSESFYRRALEDAGWQDIRVEAVSSEDAKPFDMLIPILGMPWLRVPRFLYPLKPSLITARRPR